MTNADTEGRTIIKQIKRFVRENKNRSCCFTSLGQLNYLSLLQYVDGVVGNSSSGIIEAPSFKIPTINLGKRQLGRLKPKSVINCSFDSQKFESALKMCLSKNYKRKITKYKNPYFKSNTIKNMLKILKSVNFKNSTQKLFYAKKN